jgi:endonuclease/exonuclease/phosphatase family metal-dependent hydrolase
VKVFFITIALLLNLLFVGLLVVSGLATYISPEKLILPAYLGLFFLPLVFINILFLFFWVVKLKWYFVFSLAVLVFSFNNFCNDFPFNGKAKNEFPAANDSSSISEVSLLSYNVKHFNFYKKDKQKEHFNEIVDYIIKRDADIVCLQEFGYYNEKKFLSEDDIMNMFSKKYPYRHIVYQYGTNEKNAYGVATLSKYPIVKKQEMDYDSKFNRSIFSDIKIAGRRLRVFNCHLESNQLTHNDRKRMAKLMDSTNQKNISETTEMLTRKLGFAYRKRAHQADLIAEAIRESPHSVVVCGDFNDTPISYTYQTIRADLNDVFVNCSTGPGITYNELPFLYRIDYILCSNEIAAARFKIDRVKFSDHYPISCVLRIEDE